MKIRRPAYVSDADGVGTTLYTAAVGDFAPRFGDGSREAHDEAGAWPVPGPLATLRRDVDSIDDLRAATRLGLGPRTTTVVAELDLS